MARIAIPVSNQLLSTKFSDCAYFNVFEIDQQKNVFLKKEEPISKELQSLGTWIIANGITDIIAHRMDKTLVNYFSDTKINLFIGVSISSPEQLVNDYLKGTLQSDSTNL